MMETCNEIPLTKKKIKDLLLLLLFIIISIIIILINIIIMLIGISSTMICHCQRVLLTQLAYPYLMAGN